MIAKPIRGGNFERTTHPLWKYRLTDELLIKMGHAVPKPVQLETACGYVIGEWVRNHLAIFPDYMTDGASCWPDHEEGMRGFGVHDLGYQLAQILTRKQWDLTMLSIHAHDRYRLRHIVYAGVRAAGWKAYGKRDYVKIVEI